jgi:hypothetical protein
MWPPIATSLGSSAGPHANLRNPQPEIARGRESRNADARERQRIALGNERRFLSDEHLHVRPLHDTDGAPDSEHGEGAVAERRQLAAIEVEIELAGERSAQHLGVGQQGADARLADRRASAGHADGIERRGCRHVAVVGERAIIEAVHQDRAREFQRAFGRRWRRSRWRRCGLLCDETDE